MSFIKQIGSAVTKVGEVIKESYGPLAPLENERQGEGVYRYPLDVGNSALYPHTVHFQAYTPVPETISDAGGQLGGSVARGFGTLVAAGGQMVASEGSGIVSRVRNAISGGARRYEGEIDLDNPTSPRKLTVDRNRSLTGRAVQAGRAAEISDLMVMYVSNVVQEQHNNAYSKDSLTKAFGTAGFFMESGSSIIEELAAGNKLQSMTPSAVEAIMRSIKAVGGLGMDTDVLQAYGLQSLGFATNPQLEVLYNQTDLREFTFDFRMTPRSHREAMEVNAIIKKFKYHASPEFIENQGRYMKPPSYFEISYKFNGKENNRLHKFSTCVLTSIDIDYISGLEQFATYDDGQPTQISLIMKFTEMEMMHKKLREQGY